MNQKQTPEQRAKLDTFLSGLRSSIGTRDILYWISLAGAVLLLLTELADLEFTLLGALLVGIASAVLAMLLPKKEMDEDK